MMAAASRASVRAGSNCGAAFASVAALLQIPVGPRRARAGFVLPVERDALRVRRPAPAGPVRDVEIGWHLPAESPVQRRVAVAHDARPAPLANQRRLDVGEGLRDG